MTKGKFLSLFGFVVVGFISTILCLNAALAAPRYQPGETLDPGCTPSDPDCTVKAPALSGANADITSLSSLNSVTTTDSIYSGGIIHGHGNSIFDGTLKVANTIISGVGTSNIVVNAGVNMVETGTQINTISGGGNSVAPNLIGTTGKPYYHDFTPTDWSDDTGYVARSAEVATISGGYDNIVNQLAGAIVGGGHNFLKYNSTGHSIIGAGSYNLISAGRSGIFNGTANTITGSNKEYSFIGGGYDNNIVGNYSVIPGGQSNAVNGDYSFAFGMRARANANGVIALSDSNTGIFEVATPNVFGARYVGGYWFTGGNMGVGTTTPGYKLSIDGTLGVNGHVYLDSSGITATAVSNPLTTASESWIGPSETSGVYFKGSKYGFGTNNPGERIDILGFGLKLGADWANEGIRSDAANKGAYIVTPHRNLSQAPVTAFYGFNSSADNRISIGGGLSSNTAATYINFYTAADNTTLSGTERMRINSQGNVGIGVSSPTSTLTVYGTSMILGNSTTTGNVTIGGAAALSGYTVCYTTGGLLGHCTSAVGSDGKCTCEAN